jgi:hypothetical protein
MSLIDSHTNFELILLSQLCETLLSLNTNTTTIQSTTMFVSPYDHYPFAPSRSTCVPSHCTIAPSSSSFWLGNDEDVFDMMMMMPWESSQGTCCRGASARQDRELAARRFKEIQHREAMKKRQAVEMARREKERKAQVEQRRRREEQRRLALEKERTRRRMCEWTILEETRAGVAIGIVLKHSVSSDDVQLEANNKGLLKITVTKNVPLYRNVRDVYGRVVALQKYGFQKKKAWSDAIKVSSSIDVEKFSAQLQGNVIVVTMPYKKRQSPGRRQKTPQPWEDVMVESSETDASEDDEPSLIIKGDDDNDLPQSVTVGTKIDAQVVRDTTVPVNVSTAKTEAEIWEELDGSVEDCEL